MNPAPFSLAEVAVQTATMTLDSEGWHPTLRHAVAELNAEQAAWKPSPENNSVHDIVRHLLRWKRALLAGFETPWTRELFGAVAAADWQPLEHDADWEADRAALLAVSEELRERVGALGDEALASSGISGRTADLWFVINCLTHDAYHSGQIMLLRRLQGV